jgi:hypothetical protein
MRMMRQRGEDPVLDSVTDFIVQFVPLDVRRDNPLLCRTLATELCSEGWIDRSRDTRRYQVKVVPLNERCGGMYAVTDDVTKCTVAYFVLSFDAEIYAANMNNREGE